MSCSACLQLTGSNLQWRPSCSNWRLCCRRCLLAPQGGCCRQLTAHLRLLHLPSLAAQEPARQLLAPGTGPGPLSGALRELLLCRLGETPRGLMPTSAPGLLLEMQLDGTMLNAISYVAIFSACEQMGVCGACDSGQASQQALHQAPVLHAISYSASCWD